MADSLDDLAGLEGIAEGSTATVGAQTYEYDSVEGWVDPSSGGGSGGGADVFVVHATIDWDNSTFSTDASLADILSAIEAGEAVILVDGNGYTYSTKPEWADGSIVNIDFMCENMLLANGTMTCELISLYIVDVNGTATYRVSTSNSTWSVT